MALIIVKGLEGKFLLTYGYTFGVAPVSSSAYGVGTYGVATYGAPAQVPPTISNVVATILSPTSVQITWTTDAVATSQVQYGLTPTYTQSSALDNTPVTNHSVTLVALQPNTLYHFRVASTGLVSGLTAFSGDRTVQTPAAPNSTLTNFRVVSIGPQQVTVGWDTSLLDDSSVQYGLTSAYGQQTVTDSTTRQSHLVTITGLLPNTTYHLQALSRDPGGVLLVSNDLVITTPLPQGRIFTWIEPNGTAHVLDKTVDPAFLVFQGSKGHGHPPTVFLEDHVPLHNASITRAVLHDVREIDVPLMVTMPDYPSLLTKVRQLRQWTNQQLGDGTLQIADPDGTVRQFTCRLKSGLEGQEGQDISGPTWRKLVLVFRTTGTDPYARWPSALNFSYSQAAASATWFPLIPIQLGGAGIFANPTINNPGDVDAEPIWTIQGPITNPVLTNNTTGAKISLTTSLIAGQTITIDTRFRIKSVVRNDGTKLFSALSNDSALWTMAPGQNIISVVASGTTSVSQVLLSFTPRTL